MIIYKEIKKIAKYNQRIHALVAQLEEKMDTSSIDWSTAMLATMKKEVIEKYSLVDNLYYCDQKQISDDWYSGYLYFKTDVPGQYVKVFFEC